MDPRPIGVFDSGIGGLTVVRELFEQLPHETVIYFGDTARVPYGTKSPSVIRRFGAQNTEFLLQYGVKLIVVACHTVSSIALNDLKSQYNVSFIGVVEPGIQAALSTTQNHRIGVIGTRATILSEAYPKGILAQRKESKVFSVACPLFVPLVEEGWIEGPITESIARMYLDSLCRENIDTLILGCTHYPLLKPVIQRVVGEEVTLIDSAKETARRVKEYLVENHLENDSLEKPTHQFFVSDIPGHFQKMASLCLHSPIESVVQVDLDAMVHAPKT